MRVKIILGNGLSFTFKHEDVTDDDLKSWASGTGFLLREDVLEANFDLEGVEAVAMNLAGAVVMRLEGEHGE